MVYILNRTYQLSTTFPAHAFNNWHMCYQITQKLMKTSTPTFHIANNRTRLRRNYLPLQLLCNHFKKFFAMDSSSFRNIDLIFAQSALRLCISTLSLNSNPSLGNRKGEWLIFLHDNDNFSHESNSSYIWCYIKAMKSGIRYRDFLSPMSRCTESCYCRPSWKLSRLRPFPV